MSVESYQYLKQFAHVVPSFINSLVVALGSTFLALVLAIPAAYAIVRYGTLPGRAFLVIMLFSRMIPYVSVAIPFFMIMKSFRLIDTRFALILAHSTINLPLGIWLIASYLEGTPFQLEEAARIDGCSRLGALVRIIVPTMIGGIAITSLFCFLTSWNEFLFSLLLTTAKAKTTPIAIAELKTQYSIDWGAMTALSTLFSLPVVIFSLLMQNRIVSGMTMGAVKQ
jgi:multiple sugar transport system permease protein